MWVRTSRILSPSNAVSRIVGYTVLQGYPTAELLDRAPMKLLDRYTRSQEKNTFSSFLLPLEVQVGNEKKAGLKTLSHV